MSDAGGDAACWLDRVCDDCGGLLDPDEPHTCRDPAAPTEPRPLPEDG